MTIKTIKFTKYFKRKEEKKIKIFFHLLQISFGTFYSDDSHVDINAMYEGKAYIESDMNKKESKLLLKQVTLRENRRIKCFVQIPGDTEGQISDSTSLVVVGENILICSQYNTFYTPKVILCV